MAPINRRGDAASRRNEEERLDINALTIAISRGVSDGNTALVSTIVARSDKNHDLRDSVETNTLKVYELDREVSLLKGVIVSLVGNGDGTTGMVPRLERDIRGLGTEMASMRGEVKDVMAGMGRMENALKSITEQQSVQRSWTDGWRGVGVAIGIIAACLAVVGAMVSGTVWLFTHGAKP